MSGTTPTRAPRRRSSTRPSAAVELPPQEALAAASGDAHWQQKMQRLRARELAEADLVVHLDDRLRQAHGQALTALLSARADGDDTEGKRARITACEKHLEDVEQQLEAATEKLRFRALPRPEYEALVAAHPPTDEQERNGEVYNADTFAPVLIAACSLDGMTEEDAAELLATWNSAEAGHLFQTAVMVNQSSRLVLDLGKGSRATSR